MNEQEKALQAEGAAKPAQPAAKIYAIDSRERLLVPLTFGFCLLLVNTLLTCGSGLGWASAVCAWYVLVAVCKERRLTATGESRFLLGTNLALALVSLCAVSFIWTEYASGEIVTPTQVFATGISRMIASIPGLAGTQATVSSLLVLTVSVFCLTSLDTATRLARYMFAEFFVEPGKTREDLTGWKRVITNPYVATAITVVAGVALGLTGYAKIWALFGAANQLLAALGLLAVCCWLGKIGRNNKMFYFPMFFMLIVTLTSLVFTIKAQIVGIMAGGDGVAWFYIRGIIGVLLVILAIDLVVEGIRALGRNAKAAAAK